MNEGKEKAGPSLEVSRVSKNRLRPQPRRAEPGFARPAPAPEGTSGFPAAPALLQCPWTDGPCSLPWTQQPRAPWCSERQRGFSGAKSLQNSGQNFILLLTAEQPTGHKTPHSEGGHSWRHSQYGKKGPMSMHAPNFSIQLPPSPHIGCYTDLEDFPHFPRSLHAALSTCNWMFSTFRHPQSGGWWGRRVLGLPGMAEGPCQPHSTKEMLAAAPVPAVHFPRL